MNPENILAGLLELRDYALLEEYISTYLKDHDWNSVVALLGNARYVDLSLTGRHSGEIAVREGVLDDGVINLLGLNMFYGLDVEFLSAFSNLSGTTLEEIRAQARERAKELLSAQLKRGITFFLNIESMEGTDLSVFIAPILNARKREVERLESHPPLSDVYSTSYGFNLLTIGGLTYGCQTREIQPRVVTVLRFTFRTKGRLAVTYGGVPPEVQSGLVEILGEIGSVKSLSTKQLKYSPLAFRGCSPQLKRLLWDLLRFSVGGEKSRREARERLIGAGDARALLILEPVVMAHVAGTQTVPGSMFRNLQLCIGGIDSSYPERDYGNIYPPPKIRRLYGERKVLERNLRRYLRSNS
jgi:hypothetical protein